MRRLNVKLFVFLLSTLALLACATFGVHRLQASNIADALLYQAEQAEKEGRPDQAARFLSRYLEFVPQDVEQRARLGAMLAEPKMIASPRGQKKARFVLEQVLARAPEHHPSRLLLVRVALEGRQQELALEHLTHLEKALPDSPDVAELKSLWLEQKGLEVPAAESYRRALRLDPERVENHVRLVQLLRRLEFGKPRAHAAEIDRVIAKAVELAPTHHGVLFSAAERAVDRDDNDAARKHLEKGLEAHPREVRFLLGLARLEEKAGRAEQALALIRKGLDTLPRDKHLELYWAQSNLHLDAGDMAKAQEAMARLSEIPSTETAQAFLKARVFMQQNLWHEASSALERLEPAVKSSRELSLQVALYLGICCEQLNEPARQLAAFRKVVELDPVSPVGRRGIAMAQWALGSTDSALDALRENAALARDPREPAKHRLELARMLVLANLKKGGKSWAAVERELDAADKEQPNHLDVLLLRSEVLFHQGKAGEARALLTKARARHEDKAPLWLALASLHERMEEPEQALLVLATAPDAVNVRLARARLLAKKAEPGTVDQVRPLEAGLDKFDTDDRARLWYGLGTTYYQLGQPKEAERLWRQITTLPRHGANVRVRLLLLDLAIQQNDEPGMQRVLNDLKKVEPGAKEAEGTVYRFGLALQNLWQARQGKKEMAHEAKKLLLAVEAERPYWDAAFLARAEADEILGNLDQAVSHYRKAMELGQRDNDITRKLVLLLTQTHRFDEAEKEIARLQKEAPLSEDVQRLAIVISVQRDDYSKAEQLLRKGMAGKTKDWRDHLWLGQVLAGDSRPEEAEKELRAALSLAGDQPEPYVALVRLQVRNGQAEKAQITLNTLKAKVPADKQDIPLAQGWEILGQFDQAETHLMRAMDREPGAAVLHRMHANFLIRTGKLTQAEPVLRRLAEGKVPEDAAWARRHLSLVLVTSGNPKHGLEALECVGVKLDPAGNVVEEKATTGDEELLARARVLALQQRKPLRARAITALESLQKKHSLAPEDEFLLAQLYINHGSEPVWWGKARDTLGGLVKSYPRHPQYLLLFAQQAFLHKDLAEAERLTSKLEQVEKARGLALGALGTVELKARILEAGGNGKRALALLTEYAAAPGAPPERIFLVASMHGRMGHLKEAIETSLGAKVSAEEKARNLMGLLRRFHKSTHLAKNKTLWDDQVALAEKALKDAAAAQPDKLFLLLHLADLEDLLGRYDEVETLCRRVLERDPTNLSALNNLAWLLAQRKTRPDEALELVTRAIEKHGPRPELLDTRAVVYLTQGRSEPALADLERATKDAPTAAKFFNLARAHHLMRNSKSALEALNQATALGLDDQKLHPTEREVYRQVVAELKGR